MEPDSNIYTAQARPVPPAPDGSDEGRWADGTPATAPQAASHVAAPQSPHATPAAQTPQVAQAPQAAQNAKPAAVPARQGMFGSSYDTGYSAGYAAGRQAGLAAARAGHDATGSYRAQTQTATWVAPQQPSAHAASTGAYAAQQPTATAVPLQAGAGACGAPGDGASHRGWHVAKWALASFATIPALIAIELLIVLIVLPVFLIVYGGDTSLLDSSECLLTLQVVIEAAALLFVVPWWTHVCKREIRRACPRASAQPKTAWLLVCALVALGIGMQVVITYAMAVALQFFPDVASDYAELIESAGLDTATPLAIVAAVVFAPLLEETLFRGVALQFALRAVCPTFSTNTASWQRPNFSVSEKSFWVANVIQALAFAIMHLNVVQGSYAFVLGLVLGWVAWRTGELRWPMMLHAVFNASTYVLDAVISSLTDAATLAIIAVSIALVVVGVVLLVRATRTGEKHGKR